VIGIVIVAHGGLAREYRLALEHVVGPLDQIVTIATGPDDDRLAKQAEICAAADSVDMGDGVVIVADLWGGSPCNLSLRACGPDNRRILSGANLPMLIKLAKSRRLPVDDAVARAGEAGRKYISSSQAPRAPQAEPMRNWGT
jgi:mannose PTS system EIIA component